MMAAPAPALRLARALAALRAELTVQAVPATYQAFVLNMYDDGKHEAVPERAADAEDLLTLLQSQRNYKRLMEMYYPSEDEGTNKDYARVAARRVGLEIPE